MKHLELKENLVEQCRKTIENNAEQYQEMMSKELAEAGEYGTPDDQYDSVKRQKLRRRGMLEQKRNKALMDLHTLEKIPLNSPVQTAGFGAVVLTEKQNLFISVALGTIELQGKDFFVVSPTVPIVQAMLGKKKGEKFKFRGQDIEIKEIF